ncbi:hypothetical protein DEA8626_00218 [Defluviimonas aquaemixtae]|uniref:VPLPA-CTERM protein sorting domain-containing protein n=1 Tax=Albidovulum aquaemixtae TaxID=1542388 RepID=A0A2R8B2A4_9RHOB|nr:hypothetical protein [Defluviimonas aquaemixtae]SPH16707.1 hypothetical protein DEA8626_00218 [Defluviimonas aquaemixtae]
MRSVAALILCLGLAWPAGAAQISAFSQTRNDGVYSLNNWQRSYFGAPTADYIAFVRLRSPAGTRFAVGDTFDATTAANTVVSNGAAILGYLNGSHRFLNYTGSAFDTLGLTTITRSRRNFVQGYAFLFSASAGTIRLAGNTRFNASQSRGLLSFAPAPVPLPAALPLLGGALGALGIGVAWRRRARSA